MTDFANLAINRPRSAALAEALRTTRPLTLHRPRQPEDSGFESVMHALGKVEEITAKALGQVLTNDPKYDDVFGSSNFASQITFSDLASDFGAGPQLAAAIGIGAALLNPLDPLNKLKILGLTRKGKALATASKAADSLEKVEGVWQINKAKLTAKLKELKSHLPNATDSKAVQRSIAGVERSIKGADEINAVLKELDIRNIDDIRLAPSMAAQAREGQRHLFGFSSPAKLDQASLFGLGRGALDDVSVARIGSPGLDAAVIKSVGTLLGPVSDTAKRIGHGIINRLGYATAKTARAKEFMVSVRAIFNQHRGNVEEVRRNLESLVRQFSDELTSQDFQEITQALELSQKGVVDQVVNDIARTDPEALAFKAGKGTQRITEEQAARLPSKLTDQQKLAVTPSGVSESDAANAIAGFKNSSMPAFNVGRHQGRLTGRHVVIEANSGKAMAGDLEELDKIFGQAIWKRVEVDGVSYLVQRRLPGARRVNDELFSVEHLNNLENIAAQLAGRQRAIVGITPEDILVSPSGGVQIINPDVIRQTKGSAAAVKDSRVALEELAGALGIPEGPAREFSSLRTAKAAKAVPKGVDGFSFRTIGPAGEAAPGSTLVVNGFDIMDEAVNVRPHRALVQASYDEIDPLTLAARTGDPEDFARANNIEAERRQIREALARGEQPTIAPIVTMTDDQGQLWVVNGRDRLTAAMLEGFENVPMLKRDFFGEAIDLSKGFYVGPTHKMVDVFRSAGVQTTDKLSDTSRNLLAEDYRVLNPSGSILALNDGSLEVSSDLLNNVYDYVTQGPALAGRAGEARVAAVTQLMKRKAGNLANAQIVLAEMASSSDTVGEFTSKLADFLRNDETGRSIDLTNTLISQPGMSQRLFNTRIKPAAQEHLAKLAENGALTPSTLRNPAFQQIAARQGRTIQYLENDGTLVLANPMKGQDDLLRKASDFLEQAGDPADVDPFARIALLGSEEPLVRSVRDLVGERHPRLRSGMLPHRELRLTDARKAELEEKGVLFNPTVAQMEERGLNAGVLLGAQSSGKFTRPTFAYFQTASGELVVGTKHHDVRLLWQDVFDEGPRYSQEFGVIGQGRVTVSNLLGSKIQQVSKGEIRVLENRLKDTARKLKKVGLTDSTVVDVFPGFDQAVWKQMYGERVTLGEILDEKFGLKIDELLQGHIPDRASDLPSRLLDIDGGRGIVQIERVRLKSGKVQALFDAIQDLNDQQFLAEVKASLPTNYFESYFGRTLTQAAKEALNTSFFEKIKRQTKRFKNVESFFKGRVFTDLTTVEVNEIVSQLQKSGDKNAATVIEEVVNELRDGYLLKPDKRTAILLKEISDALPSGLQLFETNAVRGTVLRFERGQAALARKEIVDTLRKHGVVADLSPEEFRAIRQGRSRELARIENEIGSRRQELRSVDDRLQGLADDAIEVNTAERDKLALQRDQLVERIATLEARQAKSIGALVDSHGPMANQIDYNTNRIWIRGEDAQRLANDGLLDANDLRGSVSDALVEVPFQKYESLLDRAGARILLVPDELRAPLDRYFSVTREPTAWNRFLNFHDDMLSLWRSWTLFPIPAYHGRNILSNTFLAWLGGVTDVGVYRDSFKMFKVLNKHRAGALTLDEANKALDELVFASATGEVRTARDVWGEFVRSGGISSGLNYNEFNRFGDLRRAGTLEREMAKRGFLKSSDVAGPVLVDNRLIRAGVRAASAIEDRFRFAAFLDTWQKTGSFEESAIHMKRMFYDYQDLSLFERDVLRRTIPFYSWSRHNIPRMLETMVLQPEKHYRLKQFVDRLELGVTGDRNPEESMPEWAQRSHGIVFAKSPDGRWMVKAADGLFPMTDAYQVLSGNIGTMLKNGLTPFIKLPLEQLSNVDTFRSDFTGGEAPTPIEQFPGQPAKNFVLSQAGFSRRATTQGPLGFMNVLLNEQNFRTLFRVGKEATQLVDDYISPRTWKQDRPSVFTSGLALLIGRSFEFDPIRARHVLFRNWSDRRERLLSFRKWAGAEGDVRAVEQLDTMLTALDLQYPGDAR